MERKIQRYRANFSAAKVNGVVKSTTNATRAVPCNWKPRFGLSDGTSYVDISI